MFFKPRYIIIASAGLLVAALVGFAENYSHISALGNYIRRVYSAAAAGSRETTNFNGSVKATPKGKTAIGISIKQLSEDTQMIIFLGRLTLKGRITPNAPGAAVPRKMNLIEKHKSASNQILSTSTFTFNVNADGTIPVQSFPVTLFDVYSKNESQELTVVPVDVNLPAGHLILNNTHSIGFSSSTNEAKAETTESPEAAPQLVFTFQNFMEGRAKNQVFGPFALKNLSQAGLALNGTLRIKGKITPDAGEPKAPTMIKVTVKHENAQNKAVLRTETFLVHVQPDGRILLQSFPFTTTNSAAIPEMLEVSAQATDKAFPFCTVNGTISFTPLI